MAKSTKRVKKKNVTKGIAHVKSSFNNTHVTITTTTGDTLSWGTAGSMGFKGTRKSTPFAAQLAAEDAARKGMGHGLREVDVYVTGPGSGREAAVRALQGDRQATSVLRRAQQVRRFEQRLQPGFGPPGYASWNWSRPCCGTRSRASANRSR